MAETIPPCINMIIMGFVAKEQFAHLTDGEIAALYAYFTKDWTVAKGIEEEKKIPIYFKQPAPRP